MRWRSLAADGQPAVVIISNSLFGVRAVQANQPHTSGESEVAPEMSEKNKTVACSSGS